MNDQLIRFAGHLFNRIVNESADLGVMLDHVLAEVESADRRVQYVMLHPRDGVKRIRFFANEMYEGDFAHAAGVSTGCNGLGTNARMGLEDLYMDLARSPTSTRLARDVADEAPSLRRRPTRVGGFSYG